MKPHRLITIAAALMLSMAFCSCKVVRASRPVRESLRTLQPLLLRSEKVDSCLLVLRGIDTTTLSRPSDKAKYALLHAMALDKNYIDTTDLSVIAPAVRYYTPWYHFNRADKFYTWYYKGRIEENGRDYEAALHSLLEAERVMGGTVDLYRSRLYFSFERVYDGSMDYRNAYDAAKKSLHYSRKSKDLFNYSTSLLDCITYAANTSNTDEVEAFLSEYEHNIGKAYEPKYYRYCWVKMMIIVLSGNSCKDSLDYYTERAIKGGIDNTLMCAYASGMLGHLARADSLLKSYEQSNIKRNAFPQLYYQIKSNLSKERGDYKTSLQNLELAHKEQVERLKFNLENDISALADKYHSQLSAMRLFTIFVSVFLAAIIFVLLLLLNLRKKQYRIKILERDYSGIKREADMLGYILDYGGEILSGDKDDITALKSRILSMARSVKGGSYSGLMEAAESLVKASSEDEFMRNVATLCAIYCRPLLRKLQFHGLTPFEIGYSTLLAVGYSTKEMNYILSKKSLYNTNTSIRKKLSLSENGTNLSRTIFGMLTK